MRENADHVVGLDALIDNCNDIAPSASTWVIAYFLLIAGLNYKNMKKNTVLVLGVILVIIILSVFVIKSNTSSDMSSTSSSTDTSVASSDSDVVDYSLSKTQAKRVYIDISDNSFTPKAVTIKAGTIITWINNDLVLHKITADNGGPTSNDLLNGQGYSFVYKTKGIYGYHDSAYPTMKGTVIVK